MRSSSHLSLVLYICVGDTTKPPAVGNRFFFESKSNNFGFYYLLMAGIKFLVYIGTFFRKAAIVGDFHIGD